MKEYFEQTQWQNIISNATIPSVIEYHEGFTKRFRELCETDGNRHEIAVYSLLSSITSLALDLDNKNQPFIVGFQMMCSRSLSIDEFSEEEINVLTEIADSITDPEMLARVSDVVWIRKRKYQMAQLAVKAYIKSAENLYIQYTPLALQRIERALQLATILGRTKNDFISVTSYIEAKLDSLQSQEPDVFVVKLMSLLQEQHFGDPTKYILMIKGWVKHAELSSNWYLARTLWATQARWARMLKDREAEKFSLIQEAETYVKEAEQSLSSSSIGPKHGLATAHIQSAIQALRRVGGQQPRVEELHHTLVEYQQKSIDELQGFSVPFDPSEHRKRAKDLVSGKDLSTSLLMLCHAVEAPKKSDIEEQVKIQVKDFPFRNMITNVALNEKGRVVTQRPSMMSDDPKQADQALRAEMLRQASLVQQFNVTSTIDAIREQIISEHYIREDELLSIILYSPFCPPGRERTFARGLLAGFKGDFVTSTHLLIPQLENSIRFILEQSGEIVSSLTVSGIQDERDLNTLLFHPYYPKLAELLGEDLVFDLQGLLVERFGSNYRNRMAHGLLNDADFYTPTAEYVWWITFRLVLDSYLIALHESDSSGNMQEAPN